MIPPIDAADEAQEHPEPKLSSTRPSPDRPTIMPDAAGEDVDHILADANPAEDGSGEGPLSCAGLRPAAGTQHRFADYELIRKIGIGGFGAVYLARHITQNREVALKVLARSKAARPDFLGRFQREARTAVRLDHPNIVRGYDLVEWEGWHAYAMEYVDGESLQAPMLRMGRLSVGDGVHITLKVASALQFAHDQGLVHRDIKPENILLTRDGVVKVADLGLVKSVDEDLSLTRTGAGFGTPFYMAPEQARNAKHVDHRSDIYALGATLYYCLTSQLPFQGETAADLILAKLQDPYRPMRKLQRDLPELLDLVVAKMLARNPQDRYQTCRGVIQDLQRLRLANPTLSFISSPRPAEIQLGAREHCPTLEMDVAVQTPQPGSDPADQWWFVRYANPDKKAVTRKLTTRQLQAKIRDDERFDLRAEASLVEEGPYRPLMAYPQFQPSFQERQSHSVRAKNEQKAGKLKEMYREAESQIEDERRKRQEADEDEKRQLEELVQHRVVQDSVKSAKNLVSSAKQWLAESKPLQRIEKETGIQPGSKIPARILLAGGLLLVAAVLGACTLSYLLRAFFS